MNGRPGGGVSTISLPGSSVEDENIYDDIQTGINREICQSPVCPVRGRDRGVHSHWCGAWVCGRSVYPKLVASENLHRVAVLEFGCAVWDFRGAARIRAFRLAQAPGANSVVPTPDRAQHAFHAHAGCLRAGPVSAKWLFAQTRFRVRAVPSALTLPLFDAKAKDFLDAVLR
jgi:hypothetical protein